MESDKSSTVQRQSEKIKENAPSVSQSFPGSSVFIREAFKMRGATEEAAEVMLNSISAGTLRQYSKPLKSWWNYCQEGNNDPYDVAISDALNFFTTTLESVNSFSTINTYRAALSLIAGGDLGNNKHISRFFKGAAVLKPKKYKYDVTWDPKPVLNKLTTWYPHEGLTLEMLTKKLVTLLALTTAQRIQTLTVIRLENINLNSEPVRIKITDPIKTSSRSKFQPSLEVPTFTEQPELCVVTTLRDYIERTTALRKGASSTGNLFLTYKKPHHPATSQTLSRWIKEILEKSGVNTKIFSAYSTRHAATSAAARKGTNIETIRRAAGWSATSSMFARFYNRPLADSTTFASTILQK
ncbi:uncharacterized protein LOC127282526 [Leptopilina boulardi]|uniref:uncharacterized protein LOC127282526 n=1 Tax=Leptopilina boulardi TaxID=63433 RepID=UPI0021F5BF45|nr:uncharacterized protein LOC127282526 [Leptopilina boulardi]